MNYETFGAKELAQDESFQQWVLQGDRTSHAFWTQWVQEHPEKREDVEEARHFLTSLRFRQHALTSEELTQMWERIDHATAPPALRVTSRWGMGQRVAATVALLLTLGAALYLWQARTPAEYVTAFGETREIILPDGTVALLNGNTRLRLADTWDAAHVREVWLDGEAFFQVTHQEAYEENARFRVHTADLDVEVLGTEFNVTTATQGTQVVLETGKVRVDLAPSQLAQEVVMEPGELVAFSRATRQVEQRPVNTERYTSWTDRYLVIDDMSLHEIGELITRTYGRPVIIADTSLAQQHLSGNLPADNLELLLDALAMSRNLAITYENDNILIKRKE
ncbi:ferric-dicitrate binding protein FerR, regulates iron transport through sigma-19 [Catalinimonas alkaloidigena]|uniref:Ferric-dicitrate binding protein FerR, regulates iron transport through sigma-19 n=1 Tax=Catalinimonas alkaloidigena TaxID=1075417 RepID=A0A1G9KH39_9BACT|nr:FecR domain-containing protein [Catalinimonas alkaloidigena]SDL49220.1 ferric-dicitrate binding protein FerR, regulates iron transport through sigma-19 [Catalinimonas alkaloidigena]